MFLVIASKRGRIIAVEQGEGDGDFPPTPKAIAGRWKAQGVISSLAQVQVWEEREGWYWVPVAYNLHPVNRSGRAS